MLYLLIIFVIALFLVSYYTLGQDLFQPSCLVAASYVVSVLCAYINLDVWGVIIHSETVSVICIGLLTFYFVNLIIYLSKTRLVFRKKKRKPIIEMEPIQVEFITFILVISGQLFALLVYYQEVVRIGGSGLGLSAMMAIFRSATSYGGGESVSGIAGQLAKVSLICAEIFLFIFLTNSVMCKAKGNKRYLLPALIYIMQALLTGGGCR